MVEVGYSHHEHREARFALTDTSTPSNKVIAGRAARAVFRLFLHRRQSLSAARGFALLRLSKTVHVAGYVIDFVAAKEEWRAD